LRDVTLSLAERTYPALDLAELLWRHPVRELVTTAEPAELYVERPRALFSAWYEFFPRSEGAVVDAAGRPVRHGTFATAAQRLPAIAEDGFRRGVPAAHPSDRDGQPQGAQQRAGGPPRGRRLAVGDRVGRRWA
jgi:starch synthase (maltosyl-transferring)